VLKRRWCFRHILFASGKDKSWEPHRSPAIHNVYLNIKGGQWKLFRWKRRVGCRATLVFVCSEIWIAVKRVHKLWLILSAVKFDEYTEQLGQSHLNSNVCSVNENYRTPFAFGITTKLMFSEVTRGLSHEGNLAGRGPLATVGDPLANAQKKNVRNDGGSGCGWL